MVRQKWALNARKIIKYRSCVNQNVMKQNMEARNCYLSEKKRNRKNNNNNKYIEADQVTPDSSRKKVNKVKEN